MTTEDKLILSYSFYIFLMMVWLVLLWGATGYVIFWLNRSGWWCALALCLSFPIQPRNWNALLTGKQTEI